MAKRFAGVDVGGRGKGFHVAVVDRASVELFASPKPREVVAWLSERGPRVVAVDSPCDAARSGRRRRKGERRLAREVCGIRYTPDMSTMRAREDGYYDWILNGFRLYKRLEQRSRKEGWSVVECFPTASWTRWAGERGGRSRSAWTGQALAALGLDGVPARTSQDVRDAIAAAVTARLYAEGATERYGRIVVPRSLATARRAPAPRS
jgi:predicted nuclease with RNAse H fold